MPAYVISEVEAIDPLLFERYRSLAQAAIANCRGRYLVRKSAIKTVEGELSGKKIVIVEFPTMEMAHHWYKSAEYAEALALSQKALKRRLIFMDGLIAG